ncbi:hypothetical protein ACB094_11G168200 [Castanea mollissima]
MEGEINNFIKVWFSVLVCLSYCYAINKIVSKGPSRLICFLPIVCIFLFLPLSLYTIHLGGATAFFIAWLANFKLLLFAFGKGTLCSHPSISLGHFVALAGLPIKIQQNTSPNPLEKPQNTQNKINPSPLCILMVIMFRVYDYGDQIHPKLILILYCFHIYFSLEIILAIVVTLAQALVGLELDPQFNEPYLSTSLQDFWGRRWNLMVTSILRVTVYNPTHRSMTLSGLMHELIFYYMGRLRPTWEIMCFFLLHGFCLVVEIVLKKSFFTAGGGWRLPCLISGTLTLGFMINTSLWLFFLNTSGLRLIGVSESTLYFMSI